MKNGRILLMRHAEKTGDPLDPELSTEGRTRAQKLATYIPRKFEQPFHLFATLKSKHSNRSIEILKPLAKELGLEIDCSFADQDYGALAEKLLHKNDFDDSTVIVCWHHGNIPPLCHALGAAHGTYPNPWPSQVFNLILQFDFTDGAPKVTMIAEPFKNSD